MDRRGVRTGKPRPRTLSRRRVDHRPAGTRHGAVDGRRRVGPVGLCDCFRSTRGSSASRPSVGLRTADGSRPWLRRSSRDCVERGEGEGPRGVEERPYRRATPLRRASCPPPVTLCDDRSGVEGPFYRRHRRDGTDGLRWRVPGPSDSCPRPEVRPPNRRSETSPVPLGL